MHGRASVARRRICRRGLQGCGAGGVTQAGRYLSALEEDAGAFDAALEGGAGNTDDAAVILDAYLVQARHRTSLRASLSVSQPPPKAPNRPVQP